MAEVLSVQELLKQNPYEPRCRIPLFDDQQTTVSYKSIMLDELFRDILDKLFQVYVFEKKLRSPCFEYLRSKADSFDFKGGHKPRAYFNVIARGWLIHKTRLQKRA